MIFQNMIFERIIIWNIFFEGVESVLLDLGFGCTRILWAAFQAEALSHYRSNHY